MCGKKIPAWLLFTIICMLPLTGCGGGAPTSQAVQTLSFSGSLPQANYMQSYNAGLQVSGGKPPYSWSIGTSVGSERRSAMTTAIIRSGCI